MPRRVAVAELRDFTGGLNLRADPFQLGVSESPDLLNVDVDPRGGFTRRRGIAQFAGGVNYGTQAGTSIWTFQTDTGTKQVLVSAGAEVAYSTGSTWTTAYGTNTVLDRVRATTFNNLNYHQNGTDQAAKWTGSAMSRLGTTLAADDGSPTTGNMPIAKYITAYQGSVWVANTLEGGTRFKNRVRWSWPNRAECFRSIDYIDIDIGAEGDEILGLVPFRDRMLVLKRNSIHAIYGVFPDFQVVPVERQRGVCSPDAFVQGDGHLFFFSWPEGIYMYDGNSVTWIGEPLMPIVQDGKVPDGYQDKIAFGWGNRRLWVNVPWGSSTVPRRSFVFDPSIGKRGAWTMYSYGDYTDVPNTDLWPYTGTSNIRGFGQMVEWAPPGFDSRFLALSADVNTVVELDAAAENRDRIGGGSVPIFSYFTTSWVTPSTPAHKHRWRRADLVCRSETEQELFVQQFRNYDLTEVHRQAGITVGRSGPSGMDLVWDDATAGQWDEEGWQAGGTTTSTTLGWDIERTSQYGIARSIALRIIGPVPQNVPPQSFGWGVASIAFKYVPRRLRS